MPWDLAQPFTLELTPQSGDIDGLNHTNNAVYVQWCERIGWAHSCAGPWTWPTTTGGPRHGHPPGPLRLPAALAWASRWCWAPITASDGKPHHGAALSAGAHAMPPSCAAIGTGVRGTRQRQAPAHARSVLPHLPGGASPHPERDPPHHIHPMPMGSGSGHAPARQSRRLFFHGYPAGFDKEASMRISPL
jgi:hypothetical protein